MANLRWRRPSLYVIVMLLVAFACVFGVWRQALAEESKTVYGVKFSYSGSGTFMRQSGSVVNISAPGGTVTLSGTAANDQLAQIVVEASNKATIRLDDVNIDNDVSGGRHLIILNGDTSVEVTGENSLYANDQMSAIWSPSSVKLIGTGTLDLYKQEAATPNAAISVIARELTVGSEGGSGPTIDGLLLGGTLHGINTTLDGKLIINGGTITATNAANFQQAISGGTVVINGGNVTATMSGRNSNAIKAGNLFIKGGTVTAEMSYGAVTNGNPIAATESIQISDGTVKATSTNANAISAPGVVITGGEVVSEAGGAFSAISGTNVYIAKGADVAAGPTLTLKGGSRAFSGSVVLVSSKDGSDDFYPWLALAGETGSQRVVSFAGASNTATKPTQSYTPPSLAGEAQSVLPGSAPAAVMTFYQQQLTLLPAELSASLKLDDAEYGQGTNLAKPGDTGKGLSLEASFTAPEGVSLPDDLGNSVIDLINVTGIKVTSGDTTSPNGAVNEWSVSTGKGKLTISAAAEGLTTKVVASFTKGAPFLEVYGMEAVDSLRLTMSYPVTLVANGGKISGDESKDTLATDGEGKLSLPGAERDGCVFLGWYDLETKQRIEDGATFTKTTTLEAQWAQPSLAFIPSKLTIDEGNDAYYTIRYTLSPLTPGITVPSNMDALQKDNLNVVIESADLTISNLSITKEVIVDRPNECSITVHTKDYSAEDGITINLKATYNSIESKADLIIENLDPVEPGGINVSYYLNYPYVNDPARVETVSADQEVPYWAPTRQGMMFLGWYTEREGGEYVNIKDEEIKVTKDTSYYAHWGKPSLTIEAVKNTLRAGEATDVKVTVSVTELSPDGRQETLMDRPIDIQASDRRELSRGEISSAGDSQTFTYTAPSDSSATSPIKVVITASWEGTEGSTTITVEPSEYTVTFLTNGGKFDGDSTKKTQNVSVNDKPKYPVVPTKEGHVFLGWYYRNDDEWKHAEPVTIDNPTELNIPVTGNLTLTAQWGVLNIELSPAVYQVEPNTTQEYTAILSVKPIRDDVRLPTVHELKEGKITVQVTKGVGEPEVVEPTTITGDNEAIAKFKVTASSTPTLMTVDVTWAPTEAQSVSVRSDAKLAVVNEVAEDPAEPVHLYNVTLDGNGGSWNGASKNYETIKAVKGQVIELPKDIKNGDQQFLGWYMPEANGSWDLAKHDGDSQSVIVDRDLTLTAQWGFKTEPALIIRPSVQEVRTSEQASFTAILTYKPENPAIDPFVDPEWAKDSNITTPDEFKLDNHWTLAAEGMSYADKEGSEGKPFETAAPQPLGDSAPSAASITMMAPNEPTVIDLKVTATPNSESSVGSLGELTAHAQLTVTEREPSRPTPPKPGNPDQPDNPDRPGNPDQSETPDQPQAPDQPDNPEQPDPGATATIDVHRLYLTANGSHLLTSDANEVRVLTTQHD